MLTSLSTGVSGLENFQRDMDIIGNNIANVDTYAFKSSRADFADTFSETLRVSSTGSATSNSQPAMQVGSGVTISDVVNDWNQGALNTTGVQTDLAVSGNGFFMVKDALSGVSYATRAGNFQVDANGYLVTSSGLRVQGYSDTTLTTIGDIKIDTTGYTGTTTPTPQMSSFTIDQQGRINVNMSDGTSFVRGQVLLQSFQAPQMLVKQGGNLYTGMSAAGPLATPGAPDTGGLGVIQSGALESSNVDLSTEMANMITAQRAFEANSKIITTSDEMLQVLNNLKH